jgi:hypothetical protein
MLRIRDADFFQSRIPNKKRTGKKLVVLSFFVAINSQNVNSFIFVQEQNFFLQIDKEFKYGIFHPKNVTRLSEIGVGDPGYGLKLSRLGSRGRTTTGSRIRNTDFNAALNLDTISRKDSK